MKTLTAFVLRVIFGFAAFIFIQTHSSAQCTVSAGADISKCFGQIAALGANVSATGASPFQYSWNGGVTYNASPANNVTATSTNTYTVTVLDANGCTSTDQILLTVSPSPIADAGADVSVCPGTPVQLCGVSSSSNGAIITQLWLPGGSSTACINVAPNTTTTYTYTVTDVANCQASNTVQVTTFPAVSVNAGVDQTLCLSVGSQQLTATPAGGTWSGTGVNSSGLFTATAAGSFTLTYTKVSAQGCPFSDTMVMTVINPSPPNGGSDHVVCLNTPAFQLPTAGNWSGSPLVTSGGVFTPNAVGIYNLTVSATSGGCTVTDNVQVSVLALPTINAGSDQNICVGSGAQLNGTASSSNGSITNVAWGGSWVSNSTILNPTASPLSTTTYTLYVTDNANCTASDEVVINVNAYPIVDAGANNTICSNASPTQLTGFTPAGGTWSGSGVSSSGLFTPTATGNFTLTYSFTSAQNCTATDTRVVSVIAPDVINAGSDQNICLNATPVQLLAGGTWSGSALVTSGGLFTPSAVGVYNLSYTTTSGLCQSSDQIVITVKALPTVNAGSDQSICNGQTATLSATASSSNGSITNYAWSGGTVANAASASTTTSPTLTTTFTVLVTDNASCTASDNIVITVNSLPVVNAGSDITLCNQPIPHVLAGFSPSGGTWSGQFVTPAGSFTPNGVGNFTLTYCYTNGNNCTSCDDIVVTITTATFANAGADESVCLNSPSFSLTPITPGGIWTATAMLTSAGVFTPNASGSYTCTYTTGTGTCQTSDAKLVVVHQPPTVNTGSDVSICAGASHNIDASVSSGGEPYIYSWNNASTLSDNDMQDVTATPLISTTYTLSVTDTYNCLNTDNITITVVPLAAAAFDVADTACLNTPVVFSNNSTGADNYEWSLGNGSSSLAIDPTTSYPLMGSYNITLSAFNSLGCESSALGAIEIISAPAAHLSLSVSEGCSPLSVSFMNEAIGEVMSVEWNLGGTITNDANPSPLEFIAVAESSEYTISITADNICGSDIYSETITVHPQPEAAFSTTLSSLCSPVTTHFINESQGYPDSYLWDLGNGENVADVTPADEIYTTDESSANFTIKLFAYNDCGVDSTESVVTVLPNTVEINLLPTVSLGCSPLFVEFNNSTTGATNYYFDFDDGNNSSLVSPNHVFENAGSFDVIYYANDGCSFDTSIVTIEVLPSPTIEISSNSIASCPDQNVLFFSETTGNIQSIQWDFGDGNFESGQDTEHSYAVGSEYFISANAQENNGCSSTASMMFTVHPKPIAMMSASPALSCSPMLVCTDNATAGATQQSWNFGNGVESNDLNECFEYTNEGTAPVEYTISLHVINEFYCTDSAFQTVTVQPQPVTTFELSSIESCFPLETINPMVSTSGSSAYQWLVDGINYSNEMNPSFSFDQVGEHPIQLISFNDFGCTDSYDAIYTIHPKPQIDITPFPFNGCAPLEVTFENITTNGVSYNWSFGNGEQSSASEPTITFDDEGIYDVQIFATSVHGCESVQFFDDMIEVFGLPASGFTFTPDGDVIYDLEISFADSSSGGTQYFWDFGDGFSSNESSPTHQYETGGAFYTTQTVTNEFGCTDQTTQLVNIDNTYYLFVPNSFTPDNDGINDVFIPVMSDTQFIKEYEFVVMNRWGEAVFITDNPEEGWMGNIRDGQYYSHNDCFTWTIRIEFTNKAVNQMHSGSVTVLR